MLEVSAAFHFLCLCQMYSKTSGLMDMQGPASWNKLKEAYAAKKPTAEQKEKRQWYEDDCVNGYKSGLKGGGHWLWDKAEVNKRLAALPEMPTDHNSGR